MNAKLTDILKQFRLSGLAQSLAVRLQEAAANRLSHAEFLELILLLVAVRKCSARREGPLEDAPQPLRD